MIFFYLLIILAIVKEVNGERRQEYKLAVIALPSELTVMANEVIPFD
jgi:hypothetical protein